MNRWTNDDGMGRFSSVEAWLWIIVFVHTRTTMYPVSTGSQVNFLLASSSNNSLAVSCCSLWKAFIKCPFLSVNSIFDDVIPMWWCCSVGLNFQYSEVSGRYVPRITELRLNLSKLCLEYCCLLLSKHSVYVYCLYVCICVSGRRWPWEMTGWEWLWSSLIKVCLSVCCTLAVTHHILTVLRHHYMSVSQTASVYICYTIVNYSVCLYCLWITLDMTWLERH